MLLFNRALCGLLLATITVVSTIPATLAAAGPLVEVAEGFGPNPTNVTFFIYVPAKLQSQPPILVNPHWCHGSAQAAFAGTQLATLADTYGYIMIFPDSPNTVDKCWDVSSTQTLTHDGGGDSQGIASMVKWTLAKYHGDARRVFSMGTSSGAMMTNVLLGSYPDLFAAGSAWAGVAFGCFAGDGFDVWNSDCAEGRVIKTGAEWKTIVDAAYPGYTGFRPKMQVAHGTVDTILYPQNFQEEIKEWTAVLGLPSTPVTTFDYTPASNWTTYIYGDSFQAISAAGVDHNIPTNETVVLDWFDLTCSGTGCYSRPGNIPSATSATLITTTFTSKTSTTPAPTTTTTAAIAQAKYGQCGGVGYTGPTVCLAGLTCKSWSEWYSQCL
ncbi:Acetylxylan esterase A [Phlyctema vagabunda]|uniref:Carboxylic ester hydrolase n=1 Tax=Phlyctema vagabunda TaxID=108571 RepID=A0ABR4P3V4_9HELO